MSNHLAVATVTAALRQVIADEVSGLLPNSQAEVTHVRPGGASPGTPATGVNVFLYGVTPNPQLRNADLPSRRGNGALVQRPQAALDLHYLVSFYGDDAQLDTQRLLGGVVRALHARPTLTREKLREVVASNDAFLSGSDIAEALETVRFNPVPLSLEELSRLWSVMFQVPYALSLVYRASVVLIEADVPPSPALPTHARNLYVAPFQELAIEEVMAVEGPRTPITATSTLTIRGRGLRGDVTRVRIGGELVEPTLVGEREVVLPLPAVPTEHLRAGVRSLQVVHQRLMGTPPTLHAGEESNVAAVVLRPTIVRKPGDPGHPGAVEHEIRFTPAAPPEPPKVEVQVTPLVGSRQRAVLLLNRIAAEPGAAYALSAPARTADTDTLEFDVSGVDAGTYLVRVQVDGAESLLLTDVGGTYAYPRAEIP